MSKLSKIDRDFYCSAYSYRLDGICDLSTINENRGNYNCSLLRSVGKGCQCYHRKHPTPEQFKEEYGFEWEGAMYWLYEDEDDDKDTGWVVDNYLTIKEMNVLKVCACTTFGKPDDDWRPE